MCVKEFVFILTNVFTSFFVISFIYHGQRYWFAKKFYKEFLFSLHLDFIKGLNMRPDKSKEAFHRSKRRIQAFKASKMRNKHAKLRESFGTIQTKNVLRCSLLNVNGLSEASLANVETVVGSEKPDIVILLETKRRAEESGIDISVPGYSVHESRRSNNAGDRDGGGIAVYTKLGDGIIFKHHQPDIHNQAHAFVNSERLWITLDSRTSKTAVCGLYLGCQYSDDRHGTWNDAIYTVIQQEAFTLRSKGYRVLYLGDFNGHVGNNPLHGGIPGNTAGINTNGHRLLNFITNTDSININGMCRVPGDWNTRVCDGLWTRQRGGFSSIIDFALVSKEHANTVVAMTVDDKGLLPGGSDHNWIILDVTDKFVTKKRTTNLAVKKDRWDISENQDWSEYQKNVSDYASNIVEGDVDCLASGISSAILRAMHDTIGVKVNNPRKKPRLLPPALVHEIRVRDQLEANWKSLNSAHANQGSTLVAEAEAMYDRQHAKVSELLLDFRSARRSSIIKNCLGNSVKARKNFWSHVSPSKKQTSEISAVIDPTSGAVKCNNEDIKLLTEAHLLDTFNGSMEKIQPSKNVHIDHPYNMIRESFPGSSHDHPYSVDPSPSLPALDSSGTLEKDPSSWINREFSVEEVKDALKNLKNGKAYGWDQIPNEALKNLPVCMIEKVTHLFNKIKTSGKLPKGWNKGRVTLVHKRGLRELLTNYRPITVLISLSSLYSKLLNERLIAVTEEHKLLGEIQNGFRKGRCGADNNFVLDTILWKARAKGKPIHMAFLDISKAYDTVNREILWSKLASLGFSGDFLTALKTLYSDDCVDCVVNGMTTRQVFLRRGLRQGCSLSPILFALYIMDVGNDINISELGFKLGKVVVSGLLFADDLVVVAKSASGLKSLLTIVKKGFDKLKLAISVEKSQVVSPAGDIWEVGGEDGGVALTLDQVERYNYLGTWTYGGMYRTSVEKQKLCVKTAHKYKSTCIHVSRMGPDVVDVALCTWSNIAIPAILTGCEMIPFCETRIAEIERIQGQVAKFILGIGLSSPNICAQTELGLKPFRQLLLERQLKFYFRALYLHEDRWVHQALQDHLSGEWPSPYLQYMSKIRGLLGIFSPVPAPSMMKGLVGDYFLAKINTSISSLNWIFPVEKLSRSSYVCEDESSSVITQFKLDCAGLGDKIPRMGHNKKPFCPVCPHNVPNTGIHLLFACDSLAALRKETGILSFHTQCKQNGLSLSACYKNFVNGLDSFSKPVPKYAYLERGICMKAMRELWLSRW